LEDNIVASEKNESWIGTAGRRTIIVACLIAIVTLFWVVLLVYTNLPMIVLAGIALISLLLLSVAAAWAAAAIPSRRSDTESKK
jgi:uncharacterized membrane protein YgcG